MDVGNVDSYEELKKLDEQIQAVNELAALKPIYFRLNEIIQAFPGDFDIQFTGNEVKQHLMARGTLLKQQEASAPPLPATPPPAMRAAEPASPPTPAADTAASPPAAPPPLPEMPASTVPSASFPLFPVFASAPPEPPSPPAYFADAVPPAPAAPSQSPVMSSATPSPLTYSLVDSTSPEQPPLPLGVTAENSPQPVAPPFPAMPAAPPQPVFTPDTVPFAPAASQEPPAPAATPLPSSLFDFAPPEPPLHPFATPPYPPPPPIAFPDSPAAAPTAREAAMMPGATPSPSPLIDSAPPPQPPPPIAKKPEKPPRPPKRPPAPPRPPFNWKRAAVIAPIAGVLVVLAVILFVVHQTRARNAINAARNRAAVQVDITTMPPGASVTAAVEHPAAGNGNGASCTSNCKLSLAPGTYRISASLDGFEPAAGVVTLKPRQPATISLTLQPQALSVRLLTDLDQGKVVVDDQPPVNLQDGQLVLDKVAPGAHTVKVAGQKGDASFSFEIAGARLPAVTGRVNARNMIAVLVSSFGKQARVVTNAGPWKLVVNGQGQGDAGPAGTDLTSFQPGLNEIVVGEGKDQRNMSESFGAAPMLTAFLKTDVNAGTLIVSTGQDGVRVFVNGKEYRERTQRGQLRIQTLGKVTVQVAKSGFQDEPAQTAEVKKGAEVRLQFDLKPQPLVGSLEIHGAIAGTEILVDRKSAGTVGPDGLFSVGAIQPGDHTIELRREQYLPKRLQRSFRAGQAVVLSGADVVLAVANGTIRLTRSPASAIVTYHRSDETEPHEVHGSQVELPPGSYTFVASAPGFAGAATRVQLGAGESRDVDFTLAHERPAAPVASGMAEFEDAQSWTKDGGNWVHKGGGFVPFKLPPKGVFTFTVQLLKGGGVFRAGQIRWCLQYLDAKNYLLYEIDRKNFWAGVVAKGKRYERVKTPHNLGTQKAFTIQIEVTPERAVQEVRVGNEWKVLDSFAETGRDFTQGKFGFLIQGNDEIAISDFKFVPR